MPLRGKVLIRRWSCPLSPIALRATLIRVVSADSRQSAQPSSRRLARPGLQRVPVTDQVGQDVEDLRLNRDQCAPLAANQIRTYSRWRPPRIGLGKIRPTA